VGRMVEKKAPLQLIMAYANIHQQRPDTELVMIGDGPLRAAAESLANSLALPVVFTGALPSEQVLQHLHQARVFCLPSITSANGDAEGLPISIIEALACGVPAVTSARGGVNEAVIDGHNGYTVPENDPDVMAERLLALLQNDAVAEQMSQQARHTVLEQFDLSACTSRLEAHYLASLNATTTS
jgi:colanic acid/amylovoran biosynthesis glycosyltransferase